MCLLNKTIFESLKNNNDFNLINIVGDIGIGKTSKLISECSKLDKKTIVIDCLLYSSLPYSCLYTIFNKSQAFSAENIYVKINQLLDSNNLLIFDHFDFIDADSYSLLKRVIDYRNKSYKQCGVIVLESRQPIDLNVKYQIIRCKYNKKEMVKYISTEINVKQSAAQMIVEKCSYNYYDICVFCKIFTEVNKYNEILFNNELLNIYTEYLNKYSKMFEKYMFVLNNIKMPIFYDIIDIAFPTNEKKQIFKNITQRSPLFVKANPLKNNSLKLSESYNYSSDNMKFVITNYIEENFAYTNELLNEGIENLKNFIDNVAFEKLNTYKKILILQTIIDSNNCTNYELVKYYIDLIELYNKLSASNFIISTNKEIIARTHRNFRQLADINDKYQGTILNAYYSTDKYEEVCNEICFNDIASIKTDEDRLIYAKIHYANGHPENAREILMKHIKLKNTNYYNLLASIYDWYGDNYNYKKNINLAIKKANKIVYEGKANYAKYLIYKNIHSIDVPEKKQLLEASINFFEKVDQHIYAECLYNYGTLLILLNEFCEGIEYIKKAEKIFNLHYSHKVIYCKMSHGIYCAMRKEYSKAILIWKEIEGMFTDEFTNYAVSLNILMVKMKLNQDINNDLKSIKNKMLKNSKETKNDKNLLQLSKTCSFKLQIRFYFLLKALSEYNKNNQINKKVIYYAKLAIKSCNVSSENEYLLDFLSNNNKFINGQNKIRKQILNDKCYFCNSMLWE